MLDLDLGSLFRILFALNSGSRFIFLLRKDICIAVIFFVPCNTSGDDEKILGYYAFHNLTDPIPVLAFTSGSF